MSTADDGRDPWTVTRLLDWTRQHFQHRGVDSPRLSAEMLLAHALQCPRIALYTHGLRVPEEAALRRFREYVVRAAAQEPVAYLTGKKEFFSLEFEVTSDVLIPRPETETLVSRVIDHCRRLDQERVDILDLGTGSGCIAIAILVHVPTAHAVGTDVSDAALRVAAGNANRHGVADRLCLISADGLQLPLHARPTGGFDIVASNPPYVALDDLPSLPPNVRDFEPASSLTDGGDGLGVYRFIAEGAASCLKPEGGLFVEIGRGQGRTVLDIFDSTGQFVHCGTWREGYDPHDRVLGFTRRSAQGSRAATA